MHDDDYYVVREEGFRLMLASLNYQALFGALAIGAILFASILWRNVTAMHLGLSACAFIVTCHVITGHALAKSVFEGEADVKTGLRVAQWLWYAAVVAAVAAFVSLI